MLLLAAIYNIGEICMADANTTYHTDETGLAAVSAEQNEADLYTEVIVSSGDTLWSIASHYYGSQVDKRQAVYEIQNMNHMTDTSLRSGQILRLPKVL